jgi:hypothetical protein
MPELKYTTGESILAGDFVTCAPEGAWPGQVVVQIENHSAVVGYNFSDWAHLQTGFVINTSTAGLIQYQRADEDLELVRRA